MGCPVAWTCPTHVCQTTHMPTRAHPSHADPMPLPNGTNTRSDHLRTGRHSLGETSGRHMRYSGRALRPRVRGPRVAGSIAYLVVVVCAGLDCVGHLSCSVAGLMEGHYLPFSGSDHFWWGGWFSICSGQSPLARFVWFGVTLVDMQSCDAP